MILLTIKEIIMTSLKKSKLQNLVKKYPTYDSLIDAVFKPLIGIEKDPQHSSSYILDNSDSFVKKYQNYKQAFKVLEELTGYKIGNKNTVNSEAMIKTLLHNTKRFYGCEIFDFANGGNTGQHPFFASILSLYASLDAGLLKGPVREVNEKLFLTETEMKMINIHDNGEYQEFGSVATDAKGLGKDLGEIEREAFEQLNIAALSYLQEAGNDIEAAHIFYENVVTGQLRLMHAQEELREQRISTEDFLELFEDEIANLNTSQLSDKNQEIIDERICLFEAVEDIGYSRFYGLQNTKSIAAMAKITEKLEGSTHLANYIQKEVNIDQSVIKPSFKIDDSLHNSQFKYLEGFLGTAYKIIEDTSITEVEKDFLIKKADQIAIKIYSIKMHDIIYGPAITDISTDISKEDKHYKSGGNRESLMRKNFNIIKAYALKNYPEDKTTFIPEVRKQSDLIYLYKKALEVGYKPKQGEILALMTKLPKELQFTKADKQRYNAEIQQEFPEVFKNGLRRNMWLEDKKLRNTI